MKKEFNEKEFRKFYAKHAKKHKLNPNPDDPEHHYDYRKAYSAGHEPDESGHWPSEFKEAKHPNRFVNGMDTITGNKMTQLQKFKQQYRG
jgi:hypothetical protein